MIVGIMARNKTSFIFGSSFTPKLRLDTQVYPTGPRTVVLSASATKNPSLTSLRVSRLADT